MKYVPNFSSRFRILKGGKISLVVSALIAGSTMSFAAPTGGTVTTGTATINQNGSITTINQSTNKASINWNSFSIAPTETVNFVQPSSQSVTLNRVVGTTPSLIQGAMNANGQVFLLNPNGVLFANGSQINVGGLVASTLNITDANFQAGNYLFEGNSQNSIINMGTITANNGYVAMMGKTVQNEGTIVATMGNVQLASGEKISLNLNGNSLVKLTIDQGTLNALVENKGLIQADGGQIYLTTQALNAILDGMVNNTGVIEAQTLNDVTGKVVLYAHGGTANVGGEIKAEGGFVETSGEEFTIQPNAAIKAGEWLIDPVNITINSALASAIVSALASGDVTVSTAGSNTPSTTSGESGSDGDITVSSAITWGSAQKLTLTADRNIYVNAKIENTNHVDGGVYFQAANATDKVVFGTNGKVVINNVQQLQWMNTALNGKYELGTDISAASTNAWNETSANSGIFNGFVPIGTNSSPFTGTFDGLGHTISDLYINRPSTNYVGLFGYSSGNLQNMNLSNVDISGMRYVGGLVGYNNGGTIKQVHVDGTASANTTSGNGDAGNAGGVIGHSQGGTITYCNADVAVSGSQSIGGLIGSVMGTSGNNVIVSTSYSTGSVTDSVNYNGNSYGLVGGLIGDSYWLTLSNSYSTASLHAHNHANSSSVGGLIGSTYNSSIYNSYANAAIDYSNNNTGLIFGYLGSPVEVAMVFGQIQATSPGGNSYYGATGSNAFTQYFTNTRTLKSDADLKLASTYTAIDAGTPNDNYATLSPWKLYVNNGQRIMQTTGWSIIGADGVYPTLRPEGSSTIWVLGAIPPEIITNSHSTTREEVTTDKVVTAIKSALKEPLNGSRIVGNISLEKPEINTEAKQEVSKLVQEILGQSGNFELLSITNGDISTSSVTLEELQQKAKKVGLSSTNGMNEIRVPVSRNGLVDLINGGVQLPTGLSQQFFIVKGN